MTRVHLVIRYDHRYSVSSEKFTEHFVVSVWSDRARAEKEAEQWNKLLDHPLEDINPPVGYFVESRTLDLP